jgi:hypothetical protein
MYKQGIGYAADPAVLDVYPFARFELYCLSRFILGSNAFVKTYRCADFTLQNCMIKEIVMHQRLFYHRQIAGVKFLEHIKIGKRIGAVAVNVDYHIGEIFPQGAQHFQFPAGAVFQFDARISGINHLLHFLHQQVYGIQRADRGTAFGFVIVTAD